MSLRDWPHAKFWAYSCLLWVHHKLIALLYACFYFYNFIKRLIHCPLCRFILAWGLAPQLPWLPLSTLEDKCGFVFWKWDRRLTYRRLRNKRSSYIRKDEAAFYLQIFTNSASNSFKNQRTVNLLKNKPVPIDHQISNQRELCQSFNTHFAAAGHFFDNTNLEAPLNEINPALAGRHGFFTIEFPFLLASLLSYFFWSLQPWSF